MSRKTLSTGHGIKAQFVAFIGIIRKRELNVLDHPRYRKAD